MKNLLKKLGFAGFTVLSGVSVALAAGPVGGGVGVDESGLCALISQMYGVFQILRTLAFVGAAFVIANWAWGYIKDGGPKDGILEDLKKKGTALLVGFVLLFGIGVILSFFLSSTGLGMIGCEGVIKSW